MFIISSVFAKLIFTLYVWCWQVWPVSSTYYGTTYPYATTTFCVGDASGNAWPGEQIAYVSGYNGQLAPDAAAYGMEGVYNPAVGAAYPAAPTYAQPTNGAYNYYTAAPEYAAAAAATNLAAAGVPPHWNPAGAYYEEQVAAAAALKSIDQRMQSLDMADSAASKLYAGAGGGEKKTTTWASIAKQPAKPMPQASSGGSKKKGPGMPPPPMVPGRNIDMNPWESKASSAVPKAPPPVMQAPLAPPPTIAKTAVWNGPQLVAEPPPPLMAACDLMAPPPHQMHPPHAAQLPPPQFDVSAPPPALPRKMYAAPSAPPPVAPTPSPPPQHTAPTPAPAPAQAPRPAPQPQTTAPSSQLPVASTNTATVAQSQPATTNCAKSAENGASSAHSSSNTSSSGVYSSASSAAATAAGSSQPSSLSSCSSSSGSTSSLTTRSPPAHSVVDKLRDKNNYNPRHLELPPESTRFFVIKSYSEDDVHRSIKYEIWCSTEHGNKRLDNAFHDQKATGGAVYLFFSVNGSGHFCGVAQMCSPVDYGASSSVWAQDKWKGQFGVRWVYVKDVPNSQLRHIRLENNENKPVTNSRDTQEVPYDKGLGVFKIIHAYSHTTSIFDDFTHYEKRQEEGDSNKRGGNGGGGGGGGALMQRGGPPPHRPNPFGSRGSSMHMVSIFLRPIEGWSGVRMAQWPLPTTLVETWVVWYPSG